MAPDYRLQIYPRFSTAVGSCPKMVSKNPVESSISPPCGEPSARPAKPLILLPNPVSTVSPSALAKNLLPSGISVNAIACGVIDTVMNAQLDKTERQELAEEIPAGRFCSPEEIAEVIWQTVNTPVYMTGQIIGVDEWIYLIIEPKSIRYYYIFSFSLRFLKKISFSLRVFYILDIFSDYTKEPDS